MRCGRPCRASRGRLGQVERGARRRDDTRGFSVARASFHGGDDPRASFESTQNYRDEVSIRLQSVVKAVCSRKPRLEIQLDHQTFSNSAQKAASQVLRAIGCECLTFELLQVDSSGPVVDLDNRRMGFAAE